MVARNLHNPLIPTNNNRNKAGVYLYSYSTIYPLCVSKTLAPPLQALSGRLATKVTKKDKGQSSGRGEGSDRNTLEEESAGLKVVQDDMSTVSNYSKETEEVEASTVVNYSKEEVKELLLKKKNATEVEVGRVILVNYRPAVLKKRKVKVGKSEARWRYTNRRSNSNISQV